MKRPPILRGAALQLLLAATAAAQALYPDQRVRVTAPQLDLQRQPGRLLWLDADSLVLAGPTRRWVIPRHLLTQIDSSRGQRRHTVLGLAVGGAVGFAVGAALFSPNSTGCTGSGDYAEYCRLYRVGIAVGGAGVGALVGALIRWEQWAPTRLESVQFNPAR